ncbi:hypothetical protein CLI64_18825 [Nostoc sp. CENA543]|uniref:hypothetical protein n=1 Tax=Nostoc sp. CENA543 TaxID=1869241 RepID=UPI000CA28308|nr:hypothetical protein [Nostoc sp. CENA543]AUT02274.1 hypothetical protein CLI64_18825 [Nostoc sp. CENA543]
MGENFIAAVFDGRGFYPQETIALPVNTRVRLRIEILPNKAQATVSFLATARSLQLHSPPDLSANIDKYLYVQEIPYET